MKGFCLAFILNTGEIMTTREIDMNGYFGYTSFSRWDHKIKREVRKFKKDCQDEVYPAVLANIMYQKARKYDQIGPLKENEFIVSAKFGYYCQCNRVDDGRNSIDI